MLEGFEGNMNKQQKKTFNKSDRKNLYFLVRDSHLPIF